MLTLEVMGEGGLTRSASGGPEVGAGPQAERVPSENRFRDYPAPRRLPPPKQTAPAPSPPHPPDETRAPGASLKSKVRSGFAFRNV